MTRYRFLLRALLALASAGLLVLFVVAPLYGVDRIRVSPPTFLLLLIVELSLLDVAASSRQRLASAARLAVFLVPLIFAVSLRAYVALGTRDILEWDETYYMSLATTAAEGLGLYPHIYGYPRMPIMGGTGYAAYVYAWAVQLAGPTVFALRAVSLLASIAGLAAMWLLVKTLYGSGTAWMAAALTSALQLFVMSNSIRMDAMTFAWVTSALCLTALAMQRWNAPRLHLFAGLAFGLGLQVHLDTVVTAVAVGLLYLALWVRRFRPDRRIPLPSQMLLYVSGWFLGLVVFVWLNILPDPEAFYKTTVLVRVDATGWYSGGTSSIFGSFLDPRILLAKESERYGVLFNALPRIEIILAAAAILALFARRTVVDLSVAVVIAGVLGVGAIVLNNASPLYFIHVLPALVVPLGPLFTHGLTRTSKVPTDALGPHSMLAFAVVIAALCAVNSARSVRYHLSRPAQDAADAQLASRVRAVAPQRCTVAGDAGLYVGHFADYPFFISSRPTEVAYAMLYYGITSEAAYWQIKSPDVVFSRDSLRDGLADYVSGEGLIQVDKGIWIRSGGCSAASSRNISRRY